jgi:hypothetical protein
MKIPSRFSPYAWALVLSLAGAVALTAWLDCARIRRVEFVSKQASDDAKFDRKSPSGYADGKRWLIVPEHNNPTYQWIEETQLMAARGDWRVRYIDYENAPFGRETYSASPYRWWLVLVAWTDQLFSAHPFGVSLEKAALYADPALHLLLLLGATVFVARRKGALPAALLALGLAGIYPVCAAFLPGVANDFGLSQIAAFWSVLILVCAPESEAGKGRLYFAAGVAGGCGLWINAAGQVPVILGISLGAILGALAGRIGRKPGQTDVAKVLPWRAWSYGGAITSLLGYLVEFFPGHMGQQLRVNYPLYGIAWVGLGELLWRLSSLAAGQQKPFARRDAAACVLAAAAVASLPIAILQGATKGFFSGDLLTTRLTNLPDGVVADNFTAWVTSPDASIAAVAATCLPLLLVFPSLWILMRRQTAATDRAAIGIALGPVAAALSFSFSQLRWWNSVDCMLLVLLVASAAAASAAAPVSRIPRRVLLAVLGLCVAFGVAQIAPPADSGAEANFKFTRAEVEGLYERALAQWIADRAGPDGATMFAPPLRTSSFDFYGSVRGIGTQNWENKDGVALTFRLVNSSRPDETESLVSQREITHIVIPSWDTDLDDMARIELRQPTNSFIYALHATDGVIFDWLRPLPYSLPSIAGFKDQSVLVLAVTDETDQATLRSHLVEYLVEQHQMEQAVYSSQALSRYPADIGALVALAQVRKAQGDEGGFDQELRAILSGLTIGSDRSLAWDRRVSLAVVLAIGQKPDLSRQQAMRCISESNPQRIRSLTTGSLYHLLVLAKAFGLEFPDPGLRDLSLKLLPLELRERL